MFKLISCLPILICFLFSSPGLTAENNGLSDPNAVWVYTQGTISDQSGTPLCAMVIANGQNMFSCEIPGRFLLYVPLNANNKVELQVFCSGMAPFYKELTIAEAVNYQVVMEPPAQINNINVQAQVSMGSVSGYNLISGTLTDNAGTPLCGLALANGKSMFTCAGDGTFSLEVPLDANKQITLQCFVFNMSPFLQVYNGTSELVSMPGEYQGSYSGALTGSWTGIYNPNNAQLYVSNLSDASKMEGFIGPVSQDKSFSLYGGDSGSITGSFTSSERGLSGSWTDNSGAKGTMIGFWEDGYDSAVAKYVGVYTGTVGEYAFTTIVDSKANICGGLEQEDPVIGTITNTGSFTVSNDYGHGNGQINNDGSVSGSFSIDGQGTFSMTGQRIYKVYAK